MTMDLIPLAAGGINDVSTELNPAFQFAMKALIAVFLLGVALDSKPSDFRVVARRPWVFAAVLGTQYVVLPAITVGLIAVLDVVPSVALGMVFVVCCPSGSLSNLMTHRAHGDVALSVSLTTASNGVALIATPLAFAFWGSINPETDQLMRTIHLDALEMAFQIVFLIGVPFAIGIWIAHRWPDVAARMRKPVEIGTLVVLTTVSLGALAGKLDIMLAHLGAVALAVLIQNAVSFGAGYGVGRAMRLPEHSVRATTIEIGMRNTGLALILVLAYFDGLGGAVLLVAAWAVWDVLVGLGVAQTWRRRGAPVGAPEPAAERG
ncbi:bile acid:sodium symporter family protein [Nocardioides sp. YIM 152588]|uniref:bile acid:sodium symporter family protein n=1 Tax=Nocardioides sp. YIM 152588 TaxID=3158259 RepID=UPI0032E3B4F5